MIIEKLSGIDLQSKNLGAKVQALSGSSSKVSAQKPIYVGCRSDDADQIQRINPSFEAL